MAVIKKTLFPENLEKYNTFVVDTNVNSTYFNITELPDTFTGGKNAFLIAGSKELVADTLVKIEIKDASGNIIYHEPGEGIVSSSINGETFVSEYFEGVSKVVAVYVYPDTTAYGPCTITILGELNSYYDANGLLTPIPLDWQGTYNVKWQRSINVNPTLANTTKIRFYRRPKASITEILSPIFRIESGSKVNSGVNQSFAEIKLSQMETFAGDVKRVKVFRTSEGDISDFDLIQDILVESKELLTTTQLTGSVIGNTGTFTSEVLPLFWNTGSLVAELTSSRVESGLKLNGSGLLTYTQSLDINSLNTYELNLDVFYSSSTDSNLGIYLSQVTTSTDGITPLIVSSSIATLIGTQPTKNLLDTVIPFKIDANYPSASLYFSQSQGEWHIGNISLRLSQDTAFSPDEISFITTMPTVIGNETYNFKFEFYDLNNNFVPIAVTQSADFTGGTSGQASRLLTFDSDRTAFRFSTGSFGNPAFQQLGFKVSKSNLAGSVTYASSAFDVGGNYIEPASYVGTYPGTLTNVSDAGATLSIDSFKGELSSSVMIGSIVYTASCDGLEQFETVYRFEDGENAPGVFVTSNTNQFIYKATDLTINPTGQIITIEAKRKNLGTANVALTVNSSSGAPPLTLVGPEGGINGIDTYTLAGTTYPFSSGSATYSISGSDQFGNIFSDAIKITPVKILDGFSVSVTNENTSFPATSTGTIVGGLAASSGSITVKVGNETINYSSLFVTNSFSASILSTSGLTTNNFNGTNYSINTLSQDSGSLSLLVKYKDGDGTIISSSKDITYSKVKKAAPVLNFVIGNNNQTVTAKSTGEQIDAFVTASFVVNEIYDGLTTQKTFTTSSVTSTNSYQIGRATNTTLALPPMANGTDSVDISITGSVTDSEGVSRNVFGNISLAKSKKAVPNVVISATPQAQSVLANSSGVQTGTLTNVTVRALEGTTSRFTSMSVASVEGINVSTGTSNISGNTLVLSGRTMSAAEASITLTVTHTDSEGTTGQTQTIVVRTTRVNVGADGVNGSAGTNAKTVVLTASPQSVVIYNGDGVKTPVSITLTASPQNFVDPYYEFTQNGTTIRREYQTGPTYLIPDGEEAAAETTDLWQVNVKEGNVGSVIAFDNIDVFGVKAGTNAITAFLTNEAHTLPTSTSGVVTYTGSGTSVVVFKGATELNGITSGTPTLGQFSVTTSVTTGTITIGSQSSSGNPMVFADHNSMNTDLAIIEYTINVENLVTLKKYQTLSKSKQGDTGATGATGAAGATGADGRRTATGIIYYQLSTLSAPSTPSATSYTFSSNSFGGLTSQWGIGAPTYAAGNSNAYWYSTYTVVESSAGSGTGTPTFSTPAQAIGFTGLVTFTSTNKITDGSNILENIPSGSITNHIGGPGVTTINGGKISTGIITSTGFATTAPDNGQYTLAGTIFNLDNGSLRSKNFYINSSGDAFFKGNLTGATGTFSGLVSGGSISIGTGSPAPFSVTSEGVVTATSAIIGGWSVQSGKIFKETDGNEIRLNSADTKIQLLDSGNTRFEVSTGNSLPIPSTSTDRKTLITNAGFLVARDTERFFRHATDGSTPFLGKSRVFNDSKGGMRVDGLFFHTPYDSRNFYTGTDNGSTTNGALDPTQWLPKTQEVMIYDRPGEAPGFITYTNGSRIYNQSNLKDGGGLSMGGATFRLHTGTPELDSNYGINTLPLRIRVDQDGIVQVLKDIQCYGNVIAYFSDKRLKNIEGKIENPLDKIQKLNGVYYTQGEFAESFGYEKNDTKQVGLIAQEVQEVLPEIVSIAPIDNDGKGGSISGENYLTIDYSKVVPLLVECIKELKSEIEELKKNK